MPSCWDHDRRPKIKNYLSPIIHITGKPRLKQTRRVEGKRVVTGSSGGAGRHQPQQQQQSLHLLPAELVPAFCQKDPPQLGPVIRPRRHNRKSKQSLHRLDQEPWPTRSVLLSSFHPPIICASCQNHTCGEYHRKIWEAATSRNSYGKELGSGTTPMVLQLPQYKPEL